MLNVEQMFESGELDDEYMDYILSHSDGSRLICNGDMLLDAFEDGYLLEEFLREYSSCH